MNEEVKMLRRALEECIVLLRGGLGIIREDSPTVARAHFALDVSSGKLPPGYSLDEQDTASGRIHPRLHGQFILIDGKPKYTDDPFQARLFCWDHHLSKETAP